MSAVMAAELTPTRRTLIPRMPGRGDLLIAVEGDRVLLRADQVEHLAGIPPWSGGETLIDDHWEQIDGHPAYLLEDATARCETAGTDTAAGFLTWLREILDVLLVDEVLDHAQHMPSFIGSHPVRVAAEHLDRDPQISIGRNGLFAHMHALEWITRHGVDGAWEITPLARRNGWLTIRDVPIPAPTKTRVRSYPQIYVTPAGLAQLRISLHALHPEPQDAPPPPALFD